MPLCKLHTFPTHSVHLHYNSIIHKTHMSTLHHESILESCFDEAWESFRVHNQLTEDELNWLTNNTLGTLDAIEKQAQKLFEGMCL